MKYRYIYVIHMYVSVYYIICKAVMAIAQKISWITVSESIGETEKDNTEEIIYVPMYILVST